MIIDMIIAKYVYFTCRLIYKVYMEQIHTQVLVNGQLAAFLRGGQLTI